MQIWDEVLRWIFGNERSAIWPAIIRRAPTLASMSDAQKCANDLRHDLFWEYSRAILCRSRSRLAISRILICITYVVQKADYSTMRGSQPFLVLPKDCREEKLSRQIKDDDSGIIISLIPLS
jgi:hypothetical protein